MPSFIAPGVYVIERDFSDYVASLQQTSLGMVSTSKRGPLNTPLLCTTPDQFLSRFGEPTVNSYGAHAALNYLRRGNQLWFNRVAKEYESGAAQFNTMGSATPLGLIYSFNVITGHNLNVNDYVRITQTGKATTHNAKVTSIVGTLITLDSPLIDSYNSTNSSDCDVAVSDGASAAAYAEVFGLRRINSVSVDRLVKFSAKDPGSFANYGTRQGIEVIIEDGGQFTNINETTGLPYETEGGIPLQGVIPATPSVDTKIQLINLTSSNGSVRVGEMRGVNYDSVVSAITGVDPGMGNSSASSDADTVVFTVNSTTGFTDGDSITISGTNGAYDGTHEVLNVLSATELEVLFSGTITGSSASSESGPLGFIENNDSTHYGVVYRCTNNDADGSLGYSTWVPQGVLTKRIKILYQGRQVEVFDNLIGYDSSSANYWDTMIGSPNTTTSNSSFIHAEYLGTGEQPINTYHRSKHPNNPRLLLGTDTSCKVSDTSASSSVIVRNAKGYNGENPNSDDYIGSITEDGAHTGLQVFRKVEAYDINMLCCPGISLAAVVQEVIAILDERNDCLGIIDPPFGLTPQEAVDWHNGTGTYTGYHSAFTTNRAALYYPWIKQYDPYTKRELWLPPSAVIPAVISYSDNIGEQWFAPAGIQRGKVPNAIAVEHASTLGEVEYFYGPLNGNAINPIMQFSRDGIVVYGQRTLQRFPTALDRINVRRLLFYIEKSIATISRRLVFEQNDEILWAQFRNLIEPFLQNLVGRRALEDYRVVCDETTNTPYHRNNNEVVCKIYLIPVKSAEKVILNVTVLSSGINVDEFVAADNQQ
jgi:hypothetical protein